MSPKGEQNKWSGFFFTSWEGAFKTVLTDKH